MYHYHKFPEAASSVEVPFLLPPGGANYAVNDGHAKILTSADPDVMAENPGRFVVRGKFAAGDIFEAWSASVNLDNLVFPTSLPADYSGFNFIFAAFKNLLQRTPFLYRKGAVDDNPPQLTLIEKVYVGGGKYFSPPAPLFPQMTNNQLVGLFLSAEAEDEAPMGSYFVLSSEAQPIARKIKVSPDSFLYVKF